MTRAITATPRLNGGAAPGADMGLIECCRRRVQGDDAFSFSNFRKRLVKENSAGGSISSNGGRLLREVNRRLGLTMAVARALGDRRQRGKVRHEVGAMVSQRVHAVALGFENLDDHDGLRDDLVVQSACGATGQVSVSPRQSSVS